MDQNESARPPGSYFARCRKTVWVWVLVTFRLHFLAIWNEFIVRPKKIVDFPNKAGEVAVITGGARGIGLEAIKRLLLCNYDIIMGVRNTKAGEEASENLRKEGVSTGTVKVFQLDLKSLNSVREFAHKILQETSRIDLLINNAGVMFVPYEITMDSYESTFQTNYLSHFLLTELLLPKLKETGELRTTCSRIINVSSDLHFAGGIDFDDLEKCKVYSSHKAYADSKQCQMLHTKYLNRKLEEEGAKVRVYTVHPGMIPSNLWINMASWLNRFVSIFSIFFKKPEHGGDVLLFAAISEELENCGGAYISNSKVDKPFHGVNNTALQDKLYERSLQLVDVEQQVKHEVAININE